MRGRISSSFRLLKFTEDKQRESGAKRNAACQFLRDGESDKRDHPLAQHDLHAVIRIGYIHIKRNKFRSLRVLPVNIQGIDSQDISIRTEKYRFPWGQIGSSSQLLRSPNRQPVQVINALPVRRKVEILISCIRSGNNGEPLVDAWEMIFMSRLIEYKLKG